MSDGSNTDAALASYVSRIENVEAEIAELNSDKSDLFKEAKGEGFDVPALRHVLATRRKISKNADAYAGFLILVEIYEQGLVRARGEG